MTAPRRSVEHLLVLLAGVVALAQFRMVVLMLGPQYRLSVEAAAGVLAGEPHWRVYQSRLLGPYLVKGASFFFDTFLDAHVFCTVLLLALAGGLTLLLLLDLREDPRDALVGYLVVALLTVGCFQKPWLYVWDFVDLVVFTVFNYLVARGKDYRYFAALFAVAILNRESAYFIAAFMIVDPLIKAAHDAVVRRARWRFDPKMLLAGIVLLGGGIMLVEMLRTRLLVREVGPEIVGRPKGAGSSFHFMLPENLGQIAEALASPGYVMSFLVPLGLLAYLVFAALVAWRDPRERLASALVHALMLGSILFFGIVFETRIYLALLPFVAFNLDALVPTRDASPAASQGGVQGGGETGSSASRGSGTVRPSP